MRRNDLQFFVRDGRRLNTMLRDLRYVRLGTADIDAASDFASRILGLQEIGRVGSRETGLSVYFRSDQRHHTLVYFSGDPADLLVGFDLAEGAQSKALITELAQLGFESRTGTRDERAVRNVSTMVALRDPSGNALELVVPAADSDSTFAPTRLAGITGFAQVGLRSTAPERDEIFWTRALGARVSDRIGKAPLLRIDDTHHRIALLLSPRPGIQHIAFQMGSIDDIMRAWYFLRDNGIRILFGPGRDPASSANFLYFEGPEGMIFKYVTAAKKIVNEVSHRPRQFPVALRSLCMWGSRPDIREYQSIT